MERSLIHELTFCGPKEVYEALQSTAIIVFVMLTALYLFPVWSYSVYTIFRLRKTCNSKAKSVLILPSLPIFLSILAGLGIILPCSGIYVETLQDAMLTIALMLYFELAEKVNKKLLQKEDGMNSRGLMVLNFLLSTALFLLLWSKQIILFIDFIRINNMEFDSTFFQISTDTISRLVAILLALLSLALSVLKLRNLHRQNVDVNPALHILVFYFLHQAIWLFFLFLEETQIIGSLSAAFRREYVSHFIKNIQKVFLATIIGVSYIQSCSAFYDFLESKNLFASRSDVKEEPIQAPSSSEKGENDAAEDDLEEKPSERKSSVTTFFSFKGNEVFHEVEDENGARYTDDSGKSRSA